MSALPLADIIARLTACPALAVLRDQDPSVAAPVAVGGKPGSPNGTPATEASPHTERTGNPAVSVAQQLAGQSGPDPEAHHPGTNRRTLGSPVCAVRPRRRRLVQGTCLPHGAVSSTRAALSTATARDRTPDPRVATPWCRQGISAATVPPVTQHPGRRTGTRLPRFQLCLC